jgi:capsular polysaccharide biosynthesis protein
MSPGDRPPGQAAGTFDPEAEQEIDFSRYWGVLASRWWLLVGGLFVGAIIGYAISLGGGNVYKATATIYLGQPYSASGNIALQTLQTNPSTVRAIATSPAVVGLVAVQCKTKPSTFKSGISTQPISGNLSKNGQNPLVSLTVQSSKRRVASCAANGLAHAVVDRIASFANLKIALFRAQITADERAINSLKVGIASPSVATTDKLILQTQLSARQADLSSASQLLIQATQVEAPRVLTPASAQLVTARSRRNSVVIGALIGLLLGVLAALAWDRFGARVPGPPEPA